MGITLNSDERLDTVPGSCYKIIQNIKKFSYGTDAVLLANYCNVKRGSKVVDLGTGTGIIPLLLVGRFEADKIYGLEIQKDMAEMAERSIILNKLQDKVKIINMDLRNVSDFFKKESFDVVTSNPPYMVNGGGIINSDDNFSISRHEICATLEDIVKSAEFLLRDKGEFYMIHRPYRIADIIWNLRKYKLEPKSICLVYPKIGKKPNMVLIKGVKRGNPEVRFDDPIYVYNEDGSYTDEIYKIYRMNKEKNDG